VLDNLNVKIAFLYHEISRTSRYTVNNLKCCLMKIRKGNGEIDQSHKFVTQSHYPCNKQHFSIEK
jgi:hypothetical protein